MTLRHVLRSQQFDRRFLEQLFQRSDELGALIRSGAERRMLQQKFCDRILFNVFYEPSTRTRMSFATAAAHLGMNVIGTENAREFSSAIKGETLEDTIRVLSEYHPDMIVLRHQETGAAERAAAVSTVPIMNAGDGRGQHPTQALTDVFTIRRELGRLDNIVVVIGGDLANGRTARSLAYLLGKFSGVHLRFIAPPQLAIGDDILEHLRTHAIPYTTYETIPEAFAGADVVYWTRVQKERLPADISYETMASTFTIDEEALTYLPSHARILHPLPRVNEISPAIDHDSRAAYFRQAGNGLLIRMALIEWVLG